MPARKDSLSVLVVDEEPEILAFFARILHSNGMRALLARTPEEAIAIARRGYVPIDLVVTDVLIRTEETRPRQDGNGSELVARLREFRPDVRALYMSANAEKEVIRVELMDRNFDGTSKAEAPGLVESIIAAATAPLVHRFGGMQPS
jgi:CheY-like chemotaxis protein